MMPEETIHGYRLLWTPSSDFFGLILIQMTFFFRLLFLLLRFSCKYNFLKLPDLQKIPLISYFSSNSIFKGG